MPGSVKSIIVGGGIAAGAPATVGNLPQFSGANPPDLLIDSILRQTQSGTAAIIVGTTDPESTATETFRTAGGIISEGAGADSTILGRAAACAAFTSQSIAIGYLARCGVTSNVGDSVVIGGASTLSSAATAYGADTATVIVGPRNSVTSAAGSANGFTSIVGGGNTLTNTVGGTAQNNVFIGANNTANAPNNLIVIGSSMTFANQSGNSVVIGHSMSITPAITYCVLIGEQVTVAGGNFHVLIGRQAQKQGANGDYAVAVGYQAVVNNIDYAVAIGQTASCSGGAGNIAIGRASNVSHANAGAIGPGATSERANSFLIGSDNTGGDYRTYIFGNRGDTVGSGIQDVLWRPTDADGVTSNLVGSSLTVRAGLGSGNAASAVINLDVGIVGASGATVQTARTGARVSYSATALDTYLMVFDVDNNTLERVSVGAADSGGVGFKVLRIPN